MRPERWYILERRFWRASCCAGDTTGVRGNGRSPLCSLLLPPRCRYRQAWWANSQGPGDKMRSMHVVPGRVRGTAAAPHTLRELRARPWRPLVHREEPALVGCAVLQPAEACTYCLSDLQRHAACTVTPTICADDGVAVHVLFCWVSR